MTLRRPRGRRYGGLSALLGAAVLTACAPCEGRLSPDFCEWRPIEDRTIDEGRTP